MTGISDVEYGDCSRLPLALSHGWQAPSWEEGQVGKFRQITSAHIAVCQCRIGLCNKAFFKDREALNGEVNVYVACCCGFKNTLAHARHVSQQVSNGLRGYSSSGRTKTHSPQTLEERRLIRPYAHRDLINLAHVETALRVLHHLVLGRENLLVCLMWWTIKKVVNLKKKTLKMKWH